MQEKLAELIDLFYGFRKTVAFFVLFLAAMIFRILNFVNGAEFVDLMKNVTLAFFAAAGVEHFTVMVRDHLSTKLSLSQQPSEDQATPLASSAQPVQSPKQ